MYKVFRHLAFIAIVFMIHACTEAVNLEKAINQSNRFVIGQFKNNQVLLDTITKGSDKWNELLDFGKNNSSGWSKSIALYNFDYWTGQGNFRLSSWKKGRLVVLTFPDSSRNIIQLTKEINEGELDFLIK
jgi:hypothetical protein